MDWAGPSCYSTQQRRRNGMMTRIMTLVALRDESDRERSGKSSNHFRYCIFYTGTGTGKAVGKTKSELRDAGNDTIRSEICR